MKALLILARRVSLALVCLLLGPLLTAMLGLANPGGDWRDASHSKTGLAPDPRSHREALVQVYIARAFSWRGLFGSHSWIAVKRRGAPRYIVYEVLGWHARRGGDAVSTSTRWPDREWFGSRPRVLTTLRGPLAERAIPRIRAAVARYPYRHRYRLWPGPNSNTFVAYVGRAVPDLDLDLPPTAIGKDYLPLERWRTTTPSGHGWQLSLAGLAGLLVSPAEGWEVNLLGLGFGIDPGERALRLPAIGKLPLPGLRARRPLARSSGVPAPLVAE